ncbi:hypothetical protein SLEP1_g22545 [Rubroshorea leprosula]|uniref:Uncharacterized protein n=1 Tax=Rubroshorea leprosula TaxID=152421 RepID=A0AAV5JKF9_9ROSI|nr:hypothetical protein SLEP1_g22545 [Rubroshorea leprosula]
MERIQLHGQLQLMPALVPSFEWTFKSSFKEKKGGEGNFTKKIGKKDEKKDSIEEMKSWRGEMQSLAQNPSNPIQNPPNSSPITQNPKPTNYPNPKSQNQKLPKTQNLQLPKLYPTPTHFNLKPNYPKKRKKGGGNKLKKKRGIWNPLLPHQSFLSSATEPAYPPAPSLAAPLLHPCYSASARYSNSR